ncbi:heavy metal translocating P-type ATPase [Cochlodiniinecator piscidefendens]|uniref:heavy metal translocating P-type ATPase n=1 Tax=Cochlodiniinecator piscidefendens TaxID=2715756 RepID=UPI0014081B16|nr:heavy metal translocating P-type ATPase [Cochlodiniinecator piscidefendens]
MSAAAISACPACSAAPSAEALAKAALPQDVNVVLSLPTIHCAGCIAGVERALLRHSGVVGARVNLTLKRVNIETYPEVDTSELIAVLSEAGYEAHELDAGTISATATDKAGREILTRLAVSGFAMMNVMMLSIAVWSGAEAATRDLFHWISAAIALPTIAFSAQPFFRNAWIALSARRLNMDVPISLAILLAGGMSLFETFHSGEQAYFDAALSLTFFLLAGRYLDHRTRAVARSAAEELAALEVPRATKLVDDVEVVTAIASLAVGDLVLVKPGGRMPVDGVVVSGHSEIDRSLLTGETIPVFAKPGQDISAGEVNLTGPLTLRVTAAGEDSSLHRMADLVAMAESARNKYTSLADKAAQIYAPGVHLLALIAFIAWLFITGGDVRFALNIAVAVLIITCPCALGLAVPAVTTAASGRLFRKGMLIKHGTALERLAEVDTVVFDKTGTLTEGKPVLINAESFSAEAQQIAKALSKGSAHPLAKAIASALSDRGVCDIEVANLREVPGYGMEGMVNGQAVRLGRAAWVGGDATSTTASHLKTGDAEPLSFLFEDNLRLGAQSAVEALRTQGKSVQIISGDSEAAVASLAAKLGVGTWMAETVPQEKAEAINSLTASGAKVLMVGDGLNDTAALTAAHVSMSPATALDAARVASDIVLLGEDLEPIAEALHTAQKATRRIKENFGIAALYNLIAVPIALIGLATPLAAALAMSLSSITVSLNALRLR